MDKKEIKLADLFDWSAAERVSAILFGKGSFVLDPDKLGGLITEDGRLLCVLKCKPATRYGLIASFRASLTPNYAAMIAANLSYTYNLELDPVFEFDANGQIIVGKTATRYFVDNAKLLVYGERERSSESTVVRPKGSYLKHRIN